MLTPELEQLITFALADGEVTAKEREVLLRKAQEAGIDRDEFEMILDAKIHEMKKASAPAPKADNGKLGSVRKCPACGAIIGSFSTTCPECGHEFSHVEANRSASLLFEKLQDVEMQKSRELAAHEERKNEQLKALSKMHNGGDVVGQIVNAFNSERQDEEREDLIRTFEKSARDIERKFMDQKLNLIKIFTVPNTKGDLLELLSLAASSAYDNDGVVGPEEEVWLQKTDQIYQKLLICAKDDKPTLNQATSLIVSLIKRLPRRYKNFTRIPNELMDRIREELNAEKETKREEARKNLMAVLKGWQGILIGVGLICLIVSLILINFGYGGEGLFLLSLVAIAVGFHFGKKAYKERQNGGLYD